MTDSRVTPQAVEATAVRLTDQELDDAIQYTDESWFWPEGGEKATTYDVLLDLQATRAEVERLSLLCQPLQDEIDRLNKQLDTPPWRQLDAARTEIAQLRAVLASVEGALLQGGQTAAIRAQQALFALAASPVGTGNPTQGGDGRG